MESRYWAPFFNPAPTHRTEALFQVQQSENTEALTTLTTASLEGRGSKQKGKLRRWEATTPVSTWSSGQKTLFAQGGRQPKKQEL